MAAKRSAHELFAPDAAGRKVVMQTTLSAEGQGYAQGEVVAVQMPENL